MRINYALDDFCKIFMLLDLTVLLLPFSELTDKRLVNVSAFRFSVLLKFSHKLQ